MMLSTQLFNKNDLPPFQYKISVIEYGDNNLYIGDENNTLHKLPIAFDKSSSAPGSSSSGSINGINIIPSKEITIKTKSKITSLKYIDILKKLIVQTGKELYIYDSDTLQKLQDLYSSGQHEFCEIFCLNEDPKYFIQLLVCKCVSEGLLNVSHRLASYIYEKNQFVLKLDNLNLFGKPDTLACYGNKIFCGYNTDKRPYQMIDLDSKRPKEIDKLKDLQSCKRFIKIISEDEILIMTKSDTLQPISLTTCEPLQMKSNIEITHKLINMTILNPYIIVLCDDRIMIYNKYQPKNPQYKRLLNEIILDKDMKSISTYGDQLFIASSNKISYLYPISYDKQISKCLLENKVDDAFEIFEQYVLEYDLERPKKYDELRIDAAWVYLKNLNFEMSYNIFKEINYDPKEILVLYRNYIPKDIEIIKQNNLQSKRKHMTISLMINEAISTKNMSTMNELTKMQEKSQEFLCDILEQKRKYFLSNYGTDLNEIPKFVVSNIFSVLKDEINSGLIWKATVEENLKIIDYALVLLYLELKKSDKLKQFLNENTLYCREYYEDLKEIVLENPSLFSNNELVAKFYEQFNKLNESLEQWRVIGEKDPKRVESACKEMVRLLKNVYQKDVLFKYLQWILQKNQKYAIQFFEKFDDKIISQDNILIFLKHVYGAIIPYDYIIERYLEIMVIDKKTDIISFYNELGLHYIAKLFKLKDRNSGPYISPQIPTETSKEIDNYLEKFNNLIKSPYSKYDSDILKHDLQNSWLLKEEIYLLGKLKAHKIALPKLVELKKFDDAELYCIQRNEQLLTLLFSFYKASYLKYNEEFKKDNRNMQAKENLTQISSIMSRFLKKYSGHPQVDPIEVLNSIPNEWIVANKEDINGVYSFMFNSYSTSLHKNRLAKMAKFLSEVERLNSEVKLIETGGAYTVISKDKSCEVCLKPIGKQVFVIYPNGVVAHQVCGGNLLNICPVTKQNFAKTYKP